MHRRRICRTAATVAIAGAAGCLGGDDPSGAEPTDESDDATENTTTDTMTDELPSDVLDSDRITTTTFTRTGECDSAGTAAVEFGDATVVTGCLTAHNGCAEPVVETVTDVDGGIRVVGGEEDRSDPGTACTQALVQRGYELTLGFEGDPPGAVEVVHDDAMGRETVVTESRP